MRKVAFILLIPLLLGWSVHSQAPANREQLYRINNIGVALMEEFKHEAAVAQFKKAVELDPAFLLARVNLAIAYYFARDKMNAINEARAVLKTDPKNARMHYLLGLIYKTGNQPDEAIAELEQVAAIDADDIGTNVNLGMLYSQKQQYDKALNYLRRAVELEPYNATANYSLAIALLRKGEKAEGQKMMEHFQKLRTSDYATTFGLLYFEQGRYAEVVESQGNEPDLVAKQAPAIKFTPQAVAKIDAQAAPLNDALGRKITAAEFAREDFRTRLLASFTGATGLFDADADGDLDLYATSSGGNRLWRNEGGGKFSDITESARVGGVGVAMGAVFADYNNDGKVDLFVHGYGANTLYRNNGDGTFADVTAAAKLAAAPRWTMSAAFVDFDHDGDVDLYLGNFIDMKWPGGETVRFPDDFAGDNNILYRNNGDGTFTDVTEAAGLSGGARKTVAVVCSDFNNRRDIDLIVFNYGQPAQILSNQRDGTFKDVAAQAKLDFSGKSLGAGAGDVNKDDYIDLFVPQMEGRSLIYISDGRGGYRREELAHSGTAGQVLDYDNDGLLDLLTISTEQLQLDRNQGSGFAAANKLKVDARARASSGDIDADGDTDLLVMGHDGAVQWLRNEGGNQQGWVRIDLQGRNSNKSGVGSKVEIRSGSLKQKRETYAASPAPAASDLIFGLGARRELDAVRIIWPVGIVQPEVGIAVNKATPIQELDRKGTSCPLLYAWNGTRYQFVTDFLGGCAIGYLTAPGQYNYPDTDEYILVRGDELKARNGVLSLRMNNQLEEVIYFDAVKLLAVDHPAESEIYPNERLLPAPPYPEFKVYSVQGARPPVAAVDDKGNNVLAQITAVDRSYPQDFELLPFKGYAREHSLTLDLGDVGKARRVLMLLTAWIDYADSTANLAASQAGARLTPPYLQVKNGRGEWQTVIAQLGFPAGLPKTMTVDLTGKFLTGDTRVRIVTSMRIYWDQILIDTSGGDLPIKITELPPWQAALGWRGFPQELRAGSRQPVSYNYQTIEPRAPWKAHLGHYTRYGDVQELLVAPDDMYVITRNGDEMQIDFDARALPPLPKGWRRDYLVYADGFGKDMDINSARPETVGPLPFHKMSSYPYKGDEHYPQSERHRQYLERYNTRVVTRQIKN